MYCTFSRIALFYVYNVQVLLAINVYIYIVFYDFVITDHFISNIFFSVKSMYHPVDMVNHLGGSLSWRRDLHKEKNEHLFIQ
jgi:hypothetical protein